MVVRENNRWDGSLGGNNFRLKRGEGSYTKQIGRSEGVPFQDLSNSRGQFNTRQDLRSVFQTSWAGGSTWEKPLLSDTSMDTYYTSKGLNLTTEPGNVYPQPRVSGSQYSPHNSWPNVPPVQVSSSEVYLPEQPTSGNTSMILIQDGTTSVLTNDFGLSYVREPVAMCWDAGNATMFVVTIDGYVGYLTPDSAGGSIRNLSVGTLYPGANIFMHFGRLMVWTGDILIEVTDPLGTDGQTTIYDDGMGPDMLSEVSNSGSPQVFNTRALRTAIPSSEGIWIVKNVNSEGLPQPTIHRIDRTNDGTDVGTPVASLPKNTMVLDVSYHLGGLMLSTASDMGRVFSNDTDTGHPPVTIYSLINGSLGTVGSPVGPLSPEETPYRFLGSDGANLFIGGLESVFVYDAIRGGLHRFVAENSYSPTGGSYLGMYFGENLSGDPIIAFNHSNLEDELIYHPLVDEGGITDEHYLESNYFDFNVPAEQKTVTHVTVMTDGCAADEEWTIAVETDDGSWVDIATHDDSSGKTSRQRLSTIQTGYRFRYRVTWATTGGTISNPSRLKGVAFHAVQGTMVTRWQLSIDGTEFENVENTKQRPEDVLDWVETQAANAAIVSYSDEYKSNAASTHNVKIESVSVAKSAAQEIDTISIVLTEDT